MSAREVIAESLGAMTWWDSSTWAQESAAILAALKAAGYAVVELPAHESDRPQSWLDGQVTATAGLGRVRLYQDDHRHTVDDARQIAAALLAAADAAEVSQ